MFQLSVLLVLLYAVLLVVFVALLLFRRTITRMGVSEFLRRLLRARGVRTTTAQELSVGLSGAVKPLVIDSRCRPIPSQRVSG